MNTYISTKGKTVIIAEMVDSHLLNAIKSYKERLAKLNGKPGVEEYCSQLRELITSLLDEKARRKLVEN